MIVDELSSTLQAYEQSMNEKNNQKTTKLAFQSQDFTKNDQGTNSNKKHGGPHGTGHWYGGHWNRKGHEGYNNNHGGRGNQQNDYDESDFDHQ